MVFADKTETLQKASITTEWQPLRVYLVYRLLLAISLLSLFFLSLNNATDSRLYFATTCAYLAICSLNFFTIKKTEHHSGHKAQVFIIVVIDILAITILEYANGASSSNLTILLIIAVAGGSILAQGKIATLFAAIASVAVLYQSVFIAITKSDFNSSEFVEAGLLGAAFFSTSLFAQQISARLRASEALAKQKTIEVAELEELNHHIIQRMRTGIIVADKHDGIKLINEAGWKMFGMPGLENLNIERVSSQLYQQLHQWRETDMAIRKPFKAASNGPEVTVNFTSLETDDTSDTLIFVDDNTRLAQQAQQLKLASLGGLTASIAHEIRNPLGAISHAAQLLLESPDLVKTDLRLAEIVQQHCVRMNKVIENVLQLSRRKPSEPTRLNLVNWCKEFLEDFATTLPEPAEIKLEYERDDIAFKVDPNQIHQVVSNLLLNGLRYSKKKTGKQQALLVVGIELESERPYLEVIDQGEGIPEEDFDKVFEPFYTTDKTGTGLGLYIAKELCESNQARLDLIPTDQGACLRITFAHPNKNIAI
ncbi:MAG: PAS domain-containing sensor histidine kinase [Gammaproteobacteria bacterium]|nr:MAG: PAS domain-containing sensor histidine kinase [Gammaproteobacteria bacterium]